MPQLIALLIAIIPTTIAIRFKGRSKVLLVYGSLAALVALGAATAGGDRRRLAPVVAAGVIAALLSTLFLWMNRQEAKAARSSREEALLIGLRVDDVMREVPILESGNRRVTLKTEACAKYSLPRRLGGYPETWAFLMRTPKEGAQYPNGWLFRSSQEPPAEMDSVLTKVASEVDEEYLEFEGDRKEVSAFWTEWGGPEQVKRVHGWLQALGKA